MQRKVCSTDMEQRNGRIERQGNTNDEVHIFRYVTDKTFDAYLYQMLENKQRFISQIMTSKTPERTCADIDEQALDYAEVKALCAGNPLIREEMELQNKIKDLKMEKSRFTENIYELQDNIRVKYPQEIKQLELHIKHQKVDFEKGKSAPTVKNEDGKEIFPIKIDGKTYTDRREGGKAFVDAIKANMGRVLEGKTVVVGEYRGLKLSVFNNALTHKMQACLDGEKLHYCELNMETDIGNITRLDNCINNIGAEIEVTEGKIATMKKDLEQMKVDVEKPFPRADELLKAETRLDEVHEELTSFELNDDSQAMDVYDILCEMFPEVMSGQKEWVHYEAGECFMPLNVELHGDVLSMEHHFAENGKKLYDPLVYMRVDYENQKVIPLRFENSKMGIYEDFTTAELTPEETAQKKDLLGFMETWLGNIEAQGYEPVSEQDEQIVDKNKSNVSL